MSHMPQQLRSMIEKYLPPINRSYRFDRLEIAGSLGDLGTLLPLGIGMIIINGLDPTGLFFSVGIYYLISGLYYGIPVAVQPMKVISAYAIAQGLSAGQITASGLLMAVILFIIGGTGMITVSGRYIPKAVVRGVQFTTGVLLMNQGTKLIIGKTKIQLLLQSVEPYLTVQHVGPLPIGIIIGLGFILLTLFLLNSSKIPAGLSVVAAGLALGAFLGTHQGFDAMRLGFNLPMMLPFGMPTSADFTFALLALVLPQLPMTLGNAVIANADLSQEYFGKDAQRVTGRALCFSMSGANLLSSLVGGMPLCHGAGGLAAHYRFGARTAGSNIMIGVLFVLLAILLGRHILPVLYLIPMSVLGVLLLFAGSQLALTIVDLQDRQELAIVLVMLAATLTINLAVAFGACLLLAHILHGGKR